MERRGEALVGVSGARARGAQKSSSWRTVYILGLTRVCTKMAVLHAWDPLVNSTVVIGRRDILVK